MAARSADHVKVEVHQPVAEAAAPHNLRTEIARKVFHLSSCLIPVAYVFVERPVASAVLGGLLIVAIAVEYLRYRHAGFQAWFKRWVGVMVRESEWGRITGATYVLIGGLLTISFFPKPVAIAALLITSLADAAASIVGIRFGRPVLFGKSWAGSAAFFLTALVITWNMLPGSRGVAFTAALVATGVEALPSLKLGRFELNDNLMVPLLTSLVIVLLRSDEAPVRLADALFHVS